MKCEYCTEGGGSGHIGSDLIGCGYKLCARLKQKCRQRHPTATVSSIFIYRITTCKKLKRNSDSLLCVSSGPL